MSDAAAPVPAGRPRRYGSSILFGLLLLAMVALGLWSSRPPPPRAVDAPQPLLQVYRGGTPQDLLLALPLRAGDEVRVVAEVPNDLHFALFWIEPGGGATKLAPFARRQSGKLQELAFPELKPMPLSPAPGTKLAVIVGAPDAEPSLADIAACFGAEPWPPLPRYVLMQLTPRGVELTGPKGPKLPADAEVAAPKTRLAAAAERLRARHPFFLAVAVPCE